MTANILCRRCNDTGVVEEANGPDDFDLVCCDCPAGIRKQRRGNDSIADALEKLFKFDLGND